MTATPEKMQIRPPEGGRYEGTNHNSSVGPDCLMECIAPRMVAGHGMPCPYERLFFLRLLVLGRGLIARRFFVGAFLILRAEGPASWTARHMYQLATVR